MHEGHRARMMKKIRNGAELYDHEALEVLLYFARPRINTNPIAHDLMDRFGSLKKVLNADPLDLITVKGIGPVASDFLNTTGVILGGVNSTPATMAVARSYYELEKLVCAKFYKDEGGEYSFLFLHLSGELRSITTIKDTASVEDIGKKFFKHVTLANPDGIAVVHTRKRGVKNLVYDEIVRMRYIGGLCNFAGYQLYNFYVFDKGNLLYDFKHDKECAEYFQEAKDFDLLSLVYGDLKLEPEDDQFLEDYPKIDDEFVVKQNKS